MNARDDAASFAPPRRLRFETRTGSTRYLHRVSCVVLSDWVRPE
jgi:hypothetical protein